MSTYAYDAVNRRLTMVDPGGSTSYTYDPKETGDRRDVSRPVVERALAGQLCSGYRVVSVRVKTLRCFAPAVCVTHHLVFLRRRQPPDHNDLCGWLDEHLELRQCKPGHLNRGPRRQHDRLCLR